MLVIASAAWTKAPVWTLDGKPNVISSRPGLEYSLSAQMTTDST
jgi:hypothetical protein